nr:MAG TPA: hypothetical protein [Caudoviricetes sp.]
MDFLEILSRCKVLLFAFASLKSLILLEILFSTVKILAGFQNAKIRKSLIFRTLQNLNVS